MAKRPYRRTAALLGAQPQARRRTETRWYLGVSWRVVVPIVLLTGLLLWVWLDPRWYVSAERLGVAGTSSLDTAREVALAGEVLGLHGLWLHPRQVVSRVVHEVPVVTGAEVERALYPARCLIRIQEREPVLLWQTEERLFGVDSHGVIFPTSQPSEEVPVLRGPLPQGEIVSQDVLSGVQALQALGLSVDALAYHPTRGLVWTDEAGTQVAFGLGAEMGRRWRMYQALRRDLEARGLRPRTVDVRFPEALTYSLVGSW
ncbi:MAG: cell division protein FtsQ/DivIB [Anaerolineae bacterium]